MRQGRSLMRDASSPGRGNNSTEIVTDVHVSVIRFLNHDHFFFFFFLGYHRMRFVIIACFFLRGERGSRVIGRIVDLVCR